MALRVWLPLNGSLENKGVSDNITYTLTSGNSFVSGGKISNNTLKLTKLQQILGTTSCMTGAKEVSYAFWVKVNTAWETNWLDGIRWISTNGTSTATERQEFYTNCTRTGTWYKGGAISNKLFTPGVWTHLAATINYNTGDACFYINGILQGTSSNVDTTYHCRGDFYIGDNGIDILENDVRIYDHCLSPKEVKEISQGLIFHYKLDKLQQSSENLVTGIVPGGQTTVNGLIVTTSGVNKDTYFRLQLSEPLVSGEAYTISCVGENIPENNFFRFPIGSQSNSSLPFNIYNGYNEYTFVANDNCVNNPLMLDDSNRTNAWVNQCIFKDFKLYKVKKITDSSGYGYDGTVTGTLITQTGSGRYNTSTHFNGSSYIVLSSPWKNGSIVTEFTHTAWIKWDSNCPTSVGIHSIAGGNSFFRFSLGKSNKLWAYGLRSSLDGTTTSAAGLGQYGSTSNLVNGQWYFIAVTFKNGICKCYCDGELVGTVDNSAEYPALKSTVDKLSIGSYYYNGGELAIGNVADSRIYCTELSLEDILDLYHTPANIDNLNNMHTFEFIEDDKKDSIYKNGITSTSKNINYLVNNFAETNTMADWTFSSGTINNGVVSTTGTSPYITSKTFTVNPDDIVVIDFTLSMPTPSTSTAGPGLYLGTLSSANTNRYLYNFSEHTWGTAQSNASSSWNTYFISGYNSTDTVRIKSYILGSNVNIEDVPDAYCSLNRITSTNAIQLTSGTTTNIRAGYNGGNSTMVINLYDFKIYKLTEHGITQTNNTAKTGYGYLQYNNFIEK